MGDLIYSGQSGPGADGPGLAAPWKHYESLTVHAEGHAVAVMRRDEITDAALYLNMHPCRPPAGCHETISKALPRNARLTVYVVNANGGSLRRVYKGTGEALET